MRVAVHFRVRCPCRRLPDAAMRAHNAVRMRRYAQCARNVTHSSCVMLRTVRVCLQKNCRYAQCVRDNAPAACASLLPDEGMRVAAARTSRTHARKHARNARTSSACVDIDTHACERGAFNACRDSGCARMRRRTCAAAAHNVHCQFFFLHSKHLYVHE